MEILKAKQSQTKAQISDEESAEEQPIATADKVVEIKSSSWKTIISDRKKTTASVATPVKSDFFLSFDTEVVVQAPKEPVKAERKPKELKRSRPEAIDPTPLSEVIAEE